MAAEQSAQRLAETKDVYVSLSTRATIIEQEHETQTAVLRANLSEAQLVVQRLRPENVVDVSVPLQQGKLGVSLSDDAVVLSTKGVSAAAGLPVGSRVLCVDGVAVVFPSGWRRDGVAVTSKAETIGHVKRLTAAGAASMVLAVELQVGNAQPVVASAPPTPTPAPAASPTRVADSQPSAGTQNVTIPLQQGKLGVSLSDDAVVLSTKGVSAAAGLPVGSRVLSVDGVAVSTKAETIGHVKRLTTVGAASMVLMVELSLTPVASTAHPATVPWQPHPATVLALAKGAQSSTEPLYTCVSKATLRSGIDITTKKVGLIEMGAVVQV